MPPHNLATIAPPRLCADILADAREAREDLTEAQQSRDEDAEDRATEAEQRLDDLRDEFAAKFERETGLTVEQLRDAISEAVL